MSQNPVMHMRSRHIETKFHFIWDMSEDGTISIHCVATDKMAAENLNKIFARIEVETLRTVVMGTDSTQSAQI